MTGSTDIASSLASVPFLSGLDKKQLRLIAESGKELSYRPGETIVEEGTMGVGFYLLLDGAVEVRKRSKVLATLSKGQFFGEMSLVDEHPRSADVVAVQPTKCLTISTWVFAAMVKQHPELALPMLKELARRLRDAQKSPMS
jgi:CRP-like cAMP-binding protein